MTEYNTLTLSELTFLLSEKNDNRAYSEIIERTRPHLLEYGFVLLGNWKEAEKTVALTFHHIWAFRIKLTNELNIVDYLKQVFLYRSIDYLLENGRIEEYLIGAGEVTRKANAPIFLLP